MRRRLRKGGNFINSFMAWVGGKKALRGEILARFPRNYKRYIEVFGGAGWVLFHKPPGNDFEVFNDFNGNLVNLYRCVREQPEALRDELRYMLNSRLDFEYMKGMLHSLNSIHSNHAKASHPVTSFSATKQIKGSAVCNLHPAGPSSV